MWPFDRSDDSTEEVPEKPPDKKYREEFERTRYEATVFYRNGDTETFECYGVYSRGDYHIKFNTGAQAYVRLGESVSLTYDRRTIHYGTLAREPMLEEIGTDTFVLTADTTHEYEVTGPISRGAKEWVEKYSNPELEIKRDD